MKIPQIRNTDLDNGFEYSQFKTCGGMKPLQAESV